MFKVQTAVSKFSVMRAKVSKLGYIKRLTENAFNYGVFLNIYVLVSVIVCTSCLP